MAALEAENAKLKGEVESAVRTAGAAEVSTAELLKSLKSENQRLKDDLATEKAKAVEMAETKIDTATKIASLESENARLKAELGGAAGKGERAEKGDKSDS